jgi:predicted ATPase
VDILMAPPLVGRHAEMERLGALLSAASSGKGAALFLHGEAGIGKTRLIRESESLAKEKGFRVLSGSCLFGSLTPYLPFREALRSGGMEHLFSEAAPRVEGLYLVTRSGLLVARAEREAGVLDPDIFTGMLKTVGDFVRDSFSESGGESGASLSRLTYGGQTVLVESGREAHLVALVRGQENEYLVADLEKVLASIREKHDEALRQWKEEDVLEAAVTPVLRQFLASGRYDGSEVSGADPRARRDLLFDNVALGLKREAETVPILFSIEDLQWADPSTVALLHYMRTLLRPTDRSIPSRRPCAA